MYGLTHARLLFNPFLIFAFLQTSHVPRANSTRRLFGLKVPVSPRILYRVLALKILSEIYNIKSSSTVIDREWMYWNHIDEAIKDWTHRKLVMGDSF
jgi:hypothetical protein